MMEHAKEILAGLAIFLFLALVVGACVFVGHQNNAKVREMSKVCIEQGHRGWDDSKGCF